MSEQDPTATNPEPELERAPKPAPDPVDDDGEEIPGEQPVPDDALMSPQEAVDNVTVDDAEQEDPGEPPDPLDPPEE